MKNFQDLTGHPEIDQQHHTLAELTGQLDRVCAGENSGSERCIHCPAARQAGCNHRLAHLLGELLSFMVDHFSYEERLMRQLPPTPACRAHQQAHKHAHAEISAHLSRLAVEMDELNPRQAAAHLRQVIAEWMGNHAAGLDNDLVRQLADDADVELHYDIELANLLAAA